MAVFLDFGRICRGREWNEKEKDGEKGREISWKYRAIGTASLVERIVCIWYEEEKEARKEDRYECCLLVRLKV